jgi:hypothetical protein
MPAQKKVDRKHDRKITEQVFQIYLPGILTFLFIAGLFGMLLIKGGGDLQYTNHLANISIVLLFIPLFFILLFSIIFVCLLLVGHRKLIKWLPLVFARVYTPVLNIAIIVWRLSTKITTPVINFRSFLFALTNYKKRIINDNE